MRFATPKSKIRKSPIQPKLKIGQPNDKYEKEADAMADQVMQMPPKESQIQRKCKDCEGESLQMKPLAASITSVLQRQPIEEEEEMLQMQPLEEEEEMLQMQPLEEEEEMLQPKGLTDNSKSNTSSLTIQLKESGSSGSQLSNPVKEEMDSSFGVDFSSVRVHTNEQSQKINRSLHSRAFTHGNDIYFNSGQYNPSSNEGKHLLAHELTHVVQQGAAGQKSIQKKDLSSPRMAGNPLFEDVLDNKKVIEKPQKSSEVRRIQQMLIDLGFSLPKFGTDGDFGSETKKAVKAYQHTKGITEDGRVGFGTIEELDKDFPAFSLPKDLKKKWTMPCVLSILCPWNEHLVEKVLPTFDIITFDKREFPTETYNGSTWDKGKFISGGFRSGKKMGFKNKNCETMAFIIYHEGWHAQQGSKLTGTVERETDAYISGEQWSIDVGIKGKKDFTNKATGAKESFRKTKGGETVVNDPAAETFVKQTYGGVSSKKGERILRRIGAHDVRVRKADKTEYTRAAVVGESVKGKPVFAGKKKVDPANWVCP